MVVSGEHVRAVGWLHPAHPYARGEAPAGFLSRLREYAARSSQSAEALGLSMFLGFHLCEFCGKAKGVGNFGVPSGPLLFVAPEMVVHYVEEHGYLPPAEFAAAVMASPLPGTEEYRLLAEPFRRMHEEMAAPDGDGG